MSPKQKKLAAKAPPPNKLDGKDFAVLRAEKAKGRGMGLQDEKVKPGKVMKAKRGMFSKSAMSGVKLPRKGARLIFSGYSKPFEAPQHKGRVSTIVGVKPNATIRGQRKKFKTLEEMRKAKGFKTINGKQETSDQFNKRRKAIAGARSVASKTRIGKIALGVAGAGVGAVQYLKSKMNKKKDVKKKKSGGIIQKMYESGKLEKLKLTPTQRADMVKKAKLSLKATRESLTDRNQPMKAQRLRDSLLPPKKMSGGMMKKYSKGGGADTGTAGESRSIKGVAINKLTRAARSIPKDIGTKSAIKRLVNRIKGDVRDSSKTKMMGGGMMQRPMGYDIGGGVSKAKEHKKKIKDKAGTILGYAGEIAKTLSKATPVGATKNAASIILAKVKEKKEKKTRRGKIIERLKEAPKRFPDMNKRYPVFPLPRDPSKPPKYSPLPRDPNKPPFYKPLRNLSKGGGADSGKMRKTESNRVTIKPRHSDDYHHQVGGSSSRGAGYNRGSVRPKILASGGMMQKPMGYKSGTSVKVKCKLGRNKPTKMY